MKKVASKARPLLDAGGVSATDVLMNLFIFFFIAFSLLASFTKAREGSSPEERQQEILLPGSSRDAPALAQEAVTVEVAADAAARVDGQAVGEAELTAAVRERFGERRRTVVVRAHRELSLGAIVAVMDRIWAAQPEQVALATVAPDAPLNAAAGTPHLPE